MLALGFASGLPLSLSGNTLQAWMTDAGVELLTIGVFTLVGLPYSLKFLWAPLLDRYRIPLLGRRRGWMLLTQLAVVAMLAAMAYASPASAPLVLAALAFSLAFLSASQDIVLDAYRTDVLRARERGMGAGVWVSSYRVAAWLSFTVPLLLADQLGWRFAYLAMAALMGVGVLGTLLGPEPEHPGLAPPTLQMAVVEPFREFFQRPAAFVLLLVVVLYKLGDAFAGNLTTAFLLRGVGFTLTELGAVYKAVALVCTLLGALVGGALMLRWSLFRGLLVFGLFQAVTNLAFVALATLPKDFLLMSAVVAMENLAGGMGTAAFLAFVMALCNHNYSATQFALLTSLAALGRVLAGPPAGFAAQLMGWPTFFLLTVLAAVPGLLLLWWKRSCIPSLDRNTA